MALRVMKSHENVCNAKCLFNFLADDFWANSSFHGLDEKFIEVRLGSGGFEYLLKFCEVNKSTLVTRLKHEKSGVPTELIIFRIYYLLILKWKSSKDYRFLNVLSKYHAFRYQNYLPNDSACIQLKNELKKILRRELGNGK